MKTRISTDLLTADYVELQADSDQRLAIELNEDFSPPKDDRNLLLGFHFGSRPSTHTHAAIISLRLQPLESNQLFEGWWYKGNINYSEFGPVRIAECQDYTVAILEKESTSPQNFRAQTHQAYVELINAVRSTTHTRMVKVWNYFDDINAGQGDSEKYRQFSIGRAEAFQELEVSDEDAPTGTAIGTQKGSGLALIALASRQDFRSVENPRQVSAFHYPKKYGPKSPIFSRGGFVSSDDHKLFLISGTAAVVGHESNSPYDTSLQATETLKNLDQLCHSISKQISSEAKFQLDEESVLRVYLKNPDDYDAVKKKINSSMNRSNHNVAYLQGTICRQELMVEVDGVKVT